MALRVGASLGAVAAALLLPSSVDGAPMETCSDQWDCMQWTVTNVVDNKCDALVAGACHEVFKVCVKILPKSHERPNCPDKQKGFSHFCHPDECHSDPAHPDYGLSQPGVFPFEQCQYGSPNTDLYFVFKDGAGCGGSPEQQWPLSQCEGVPAKLSCFPRPANVQTCTNNPLAPSLLSQTQKECVWHVVTPPECQKCHTTSSTPSTKPLTTPSTTSSIASSTTLGSSTTPRTTTEGQESLPKNMKSVSMDRSTKVGLAAAGGDKSVAAGGALASILLVSAGVLVVLSRRARTPAHAPMIQAEAVE